MRPWRIIRLQPYDEVDAVVLYDDVLIPWERVFLYRNARISNAYKRRWASPTTSGIRWRRGSARS